MNQAISDPTTDLKRCTAPRHQNRHEAVFVLQAVCQEGHLELRSSLLSFILKRVLLMAPDCTNCIQPKGEYGCPENWRTSQFDKLTFRIPEANDAFLTNHRRNCSAHKKERHRNGLPDLVKVNVQRVCWSPLDQFIIAFRCSWLRVVGPISGYNA